MLFLEMYVFIISHLFPKLYLTKAFLKYLFLALSIKLSVDIYTVATNHYYFTFMIQIKCNLHSNSLSYFFMEGA